MARREIISWEEFSSLADHLLKQINKPFDSLIMITPSGLVTGGVVANAIKTPQVFTARVEFESIETNQYSPRTLLLALPTFLDFPPAEKLNHHKVLVIDANWDCGRLITSVQKRVEACGGKAHTAVLHFNPYKNMLENLLPDYYAAMTDAEIIYPWEVGFGDQTNLFSPLR